MPLRYAILHHTGVSKPHFDILVETFPGSDLSTWRSTVWPIDEVVLVVRLKDHRRLYLDFEGVISHGRGQVERIAAGACEVEVGPNDTWRISLLSGTTPTLLLLKRRDAETWEARHA